MKYRLITAALLLLAQAAAAQKMSGDITVLGDAADYSSSAAGAAAGGLEADGGLSPVAFGESAAGNTQLEGGFYSRMVGQPGSFAYDAQGVSSYTLAWSALNPAGTIYELFVSSWAEADPYMAYYSTDVSGYPVESLFPNTSYYSFALANYMEGDYSQQSSTTAVTFAAVPSTGGYTLADAGHNTLSLSFTGTENSPPARLGDWGGTVSLPNGLYGHSAVVYGTHVFISGGFDGVYFSSAVYRVEIYPDGSLGEFNTAGYMPLGVYGHQSVAARGRIYVMGGYSVSGSRSDVWSADISSTGVLSDWDAENSLPESMYFHAALSDGKNILVSGGYKSGSGVLTGVYYSPIGNDGWLGTWQLLDTLPEPRYAHSMTLFPDRLVVAGGKDGSSARAEVWSFQIGAGIWTAQADLPAARYGHAAVSAGSRLYVMGGNNGYVPQQHVFQASVTVSGISQWESVSPLPDPVQFPAAALIGDKLHIFGGSDGGSVSAGSIRAELSGTEYLVQASPDPGFASDVVSSGWLPHPAAEMGDLKPLTTYYFRAKARNWTGIETGFSSNASTATYAAIPGTAAWSSVWITSATANWFSSENPPDAEYELQYSSASDFSPYISQYMVAVSSELSSLSQSTTYYARVRVYGGGIDRSRFIDLPPVRTSFDPALDVSSPVITDNQADFSGWKGTNTFLCDVDFTDVGASGVDRFQIQVSTKTGDPASVVLAWTDAVTNIDQDAYLADWALPQTVWDGMLDGATNYVSVRVYDNSGNYEDGDELFSVLKDSSPPVITSTYTVSAAWLTDYPGDVTGLRFEDALSGLDKVQYSVSTEKLFADGAVIDWTDIGTLTAGTTWYEPTLSYSFNALANATSNYFSFRAIDVAGSTRTYADAFGIAKNVSGPTVIISTPSAPFLSTFTVVSGNTAETNSHAVEGSEVSLEDTFTGLYYDGTDFLAGSRSWSDAEDEASTFTAVFQGIQLVSGREYRAVARSSDSAGDYSQLFATYTFTFDEEPPSAAVLYPADGSSAESVTYISGTASDSAAGVADVQVIFQRVSDGKWWKNDTSSWEDSPSSLQSGTTAYWTWGFQPYLRDSLDDGASYYVSVLASDASLPANTGEFYQSGSTFTYLDRTAPAESSVSAGPGSYSGAVEIVWRAAGDNGPTGYLLAGSFKVAYSTVAAAVVSTASAQVTITTATLTAGSTQTHVINGLSPDVTYYFTLWTGDDAGNWSPASSEVSGLSGSLDSGAVSGSVLDASTQPVTGVLVEAIAPSGAVEGSDYTDAYGVYSIPALNSLYLTVRAVWTAEDIESSVSKDSVPNGSAGVNFRLSVTYQLASISGVIPSNYLPAFSGVVPSASRYTTRAVSADEGSPPFIEVYSRGRRIGAAYTDSSGAFEVPNLLPGTYSVRVFNGADYSKMQTVRLYSGQALVFTPEFDLLNKAEVYAYPNPANSVVNFHFAPSAAFFEAEVQVFDIGGRLVTRLNNVTNDLPALGGKKISWDLRSDGVAPGVYLYILRIKDPSTGKDEKVVKKFAVIR